MLPARAFNRFKALLLVLLALFFVQRWASGELFYYVAPRFGWLAPVAAAILIALAGSYNLASQQDDSSDDGPHHEVEHTHRPTGVWPLAIVALPLVLGVIVPARPLGAGAAAARGVAAGGGVVQAAGAETLAIAPEARTVLDWVRLIDASPDAGALNDQPADISGFVYRDARFAPDQLMVGRFVIACCVADAFAVGVVVSAENAAAFQTDSWVRVRGAFSEGLFDGQAVPVLVASNITPIQPPEQPYLFP